jgi:murein hydrolase activator
MQRLATYLLAVALALPALTALASGTEERLQKVEQQLSASEKKHSQLLAERAALDKEMPELQAKLIAATAQADKASAALQELEDNLADLEGTAARRSAQLQEQRTSLSQTLALLQRLAITPPEVQLISPTPPLDRLHTNLQLKVLLPEIKTRTDELAASVRDLRSLRKRLEAQRSKVQREQQSYSRQSAELDALLEQRSARLVQSRAQSTALVGRMEKLTSEAADLRELLNKLEQDQPAVADDTPTPKLIALPATAAKRLPLSAPALVRFGQTDSSGSRSNGMTLRPRPGAMVAAIAKGRVAFAGPFRGYGRMVILAHSGGFHTVVAGLEKVNVAVGDAIAAGEPLGQMPASRSPAPELYFEVRKDGSAIDPLGKAAAQLTSR